jgi:hypothetical protein
MTETAPNTATVKGRTMAVRAVNATQVAMMNRMSRIAMAKADLATLAQQRGDEKEAKALVQEGLTISGQLLDGAEHLLTEQMDRDWLVEMMLRGDLELEDLQPLFEAAGEAAASKDQPPAKKAARGK